MAIRDLSYDLRPANIEEGDIVEALSNLCRDFSKKTGIKVDFFTAGMEHIEFKDVTMINMYRMIQEGLNNTRKHAEASHVNITCSYIHPDIVLRLTDNGKGFDVEKRLAAITSERRMGLQSMEERAKLLGGILGVQSRVMHGTKIHIRLPYKGKIHG